MAKRAARNKLRDRNPVETASVHRLFPSSGGWHPLESDVRDRKYVKNVRAMSPMQQELLDAIEERARSELGMIKRDEIFFQLPDERQGTQPRP